MKSKSNKTAKLRISATLIEGNAKDYLEVGGRLYKIEVEGSPDNFPARVIGYRFPEYPRDYMRKIIEGQVFQDEQGNMHSSLSKPLKLHPEKLTLEFHVDGGKR